MSQFFFLIASGLVVFNFFNSLLILDWTALIIGSVALLVLTFVFSHSKLYLKFIFWRLRVGLNDSDRHLSFEKSTLWGRTRTSKFSYDEDLLMIITHSQMNPAYIFQSSKSLDSLGRYNLSLDFPISRKGFELIYLFLRGHIQVEDYEFFKFDENPLIHDEPEVHTPEQLNIKLRELSKEPTVHRFGQHIELATYTHPIFLKFTLILIGIYSGFLLLATDGSLSSPWINSLEKRVVWVLGGSLLLIGPLLLKSRYYSYRLHMEFQSKSTQLEANKKMKLLLLRAKYQIIEESGDYLKAKGNHLIFRFLHPYSEINVEIKELEILVYGPPYLLTRMEESIEEMAKDRISELRSIDSIL